MVPITIRPLAIVVCMLAAITAASASPLPQLPFFHHTQPVPEITLPQAQRTLDNRGAAFIENRGQWDRQVKFLQKSPGLDMWITESGVRYDLYRFTSSESASEHYRSRLHPKSESPAMTRTGHVVGISFEGAAFAPAARGVQQRPGAYNYFIGNDPKKWATGARLFAEAELKNLYDGIDAHFYLDRGHPRYDLIVQPGADPAQVRMKIEGSNGVSVNADGSLAIQTSMGVLEQQGLYAYQVIDGVQRQVQCRFVIGVDKRVNFVLGSYDRNLSLVIDPLVYSTFTGGDADEESYGIAVDTSGNAYITGTTGSYDFPELHQYQSNRGSDDAFITKLVYNDSGNVELGWSTYLGGIGADNAFDIAVDDSGNVVVTGSTPSTDFPTLHPYQSSRGEIDVFVTTFAQGDNGAVSLIYSTYLGGRSIDQGLGIAVDHSGNAYITGSTLSPNFPLSHQFQNDPFETQSEAFITKLTYNGSGNVAVAYSTYLGGRNTDVGNDIAIDMDDSPCITGITSSPDFPVAHTLQSLNTAYDAFVTKLILNDSGNLALVYSTYLGGKGEESGTGIATDDSGNVYICGYTGSEDFPTVNAYQPHQGGVDVFAAKLMFRDTDTIALAWSTMLGGDEEDRATDIAIDGNNSIYITGFTGSVNFPLEKEDYTKQGSYDAFVTKLNDRDTGNVSLIYSTYLSGSDMDKGYALAVDGNGNAYVTGVTASDDFPTLSPYQTHQTGWDAFVTKLATPILLDVPAGPSSKERITLIHAVSPNPAHDNLRCSFTLPHSASVIVQIYSTDGRLVGVPVRGEEFEAGEHTISIPVMNVVPGVYTLHVLAGEVSFTEQFVVVR